MNNPVLKVPAPPTPPKLELSAADKLANFRSMLDELEAKVKYYQESIQYYQELKDQFESELTKERELLELTKNTVASLSEFVTSSPSESKSESEPTTTAKSNGNGNGKVAMIELETETKTKTKTKPKSSKTNTKTKTKNKPKSSKANTKAAKATKSTNTKSKATKANTSKKSSSKSKSTLPPSKKLDGYESITQAVLDFVSSQEGVVSVREIVKHFYPDGLPEGTDSKKVSNSFSSILSVQVKRQVLERTVPGKYLYVGKK